MRTTSPGLLIVGYEEGTAPEPRPGVSLHS